MTVKELASKTNALCREGKGDLPVYVSTDSFLSHPLRTIKEKELSVEPGTIIVLGD